MNPYAGSNGPVQTSIAKPIVAAQPSMAEEIALLKKLVSQLAEEVKTLKAQVKNIDKARRDPLCLSYDSESD